MGMTDTPYNMPPLGLFGKRCRILTGYDKRPFVYRIVNSEWMSNTWCEPPITYQSKRNPVRHDHSENVLIVVLDTLINENSSLIRVALKDVELMDEAPTVGGWISVKDRLPETQNPVIVYVPPHTNNECESYIGYVGMAYYTNFGDGFWCGTDGNVYGAIGIIHSPTHWMPLPELPIAMDEQQNRSFADAQDDRGSGASR